MTDNAADDKASIFTPITPADGGNHDRARRRRTLIAAVAALVVVAGGATWWAVASGGDDKPAKHTAVIPKTFGTFTEAKDGDTEWTTLATVNTDIAKGPVNLTYRAPDGRAAMVTVALDPPGYKSDQTDFGPGSASSTAALLGTDDPKAVTSHPAGSHGGKVQCADSGQQGHPLTICAWQSAAANVTLTSVVNGRAVVDANAPTDLVSFLDALTIEPKKG